MSEEARYQAVASMYPDCWRTRWPDAFGRAGDGQRAKRLGPQLKKRWELSFPDGLDPGRVLKPLLEPVSSLELYRQYVDPRPFVYCRVTSFAEMAGPRRSPPKDPYLDHALGRSWLWVERKKFLPDNRIPRWMIVNLRGYLELQYPLVQQRAWVVQAVGRPSLEFHNAFDDQLDLYYRFTDDVDVDEVQDQLRERLQHRRMFDNERRHYGIGPNPDYPIVVPGGYGSFLMQFGGVRPASLKWTPENALLDLAGAENDVKPLTAKAVKRSLSRGQWSPGGRGRTPKPETSRAPRFAVRAGRKGDSGNELTETITVMDVPVPLPGHEAALEVTLAYRLGFVLRPRKTKKVKKTPTRAQRYAKWHARIRAWNGALTRWAFPEATSDSFPTKRTEVLAKLIAYGNRLTPLPPTANRPDPLSADEVRFLLEWDRAFSIFELEEGLEMQPMQFNYRELRFFFQILGTMYRDGLDNLILGWEFLISRDGCSERTVKRNMQKMMEMLEYKQPGDWENQKVLTCTVRNKKLRSLVKRRWRIPVPERFQDLDTALAALLSEEELKERFDGVVLERLLGIQKALKPRPEAG